MKYVRRPSVRHGRSDDASLSRMQGVEDIACRKRRRRRFLLSVRHPAPWRAVRVAAHLRVEHRYPELWTGIMARPSGLAEGNTVPTATAKEGGNPANPPPL